MKKLPKIALAITLFALIWRGNAKANAAGFALLWLALECKGGKRQKKIESLTRRQHKLSKLLKEEVLNGISKNHVGSSRHYRVSNDSRRAGQPPIGWPQ